MDGEERVENYLKERGVDEFPDFMSGTLFERRVYSTQKKSDVYDLSRSAAVVSPLRVDLGSTHVQACALHNFVDLDSIESENVSQASQTLTLFRID